MKNNTFDRKEMIEAVEKHVDNATDDERLQFAQVGINALIDEATGFQSVRKKDDLRQQFRKLKNG